MVAKAGDVIASQDVDAGHGARGRRRRDGRAAPQAVHACCRRRLEARHRGRHRHHADRPLLRALRRPRGRASPRVVYLVTARGHAASVTESRPPSVRTRPSSARGSAGPGDEAAYLPWSARTGLAMATASAGRLGVEVLAAGLERAEVGVQLVDAAGCRWGCSARRSSSSADAVQVLDQGAQRVAVRRDQHGAARPQVRHDRVVPVRQHAGRRRLAGTRSAAAARAAASA